ncbi:hypothetical protein GCM10009662_54670 [Catellatospora coxensis]|uniref:Uncharacterized protein n=1 Tax=Catellatospora coxensis TaxID=310354 RepID=A0A8J3L126_9ACTN|nr:hypothetical protein Cco03nite_33660 [Catellatospora coxensis]
MSVDLRQPEPSTASRSAGATAIGASSAVAAGAASDGGRTAGGAGAAAAGCGSNASTVSITSAGRPGRGREDMRTSFRGSGKDAVKVAGPAITVPSQPHPLVGGHSTTAGVPPMTRTPAVAGGQ